MQLRSRTYPYPVVYPKTAKYLNTSFITSVQLKKDAYKSIFEFCARIDNETICQMLTNGDITFAIHIECPHTSFRTVFETNEFEKDFVVEDKFFNGVLSVCTFMITKRRIDNYTNCDFARDYRGKTFNIPPNAIFAIGSQTNFVLTKKESELSGASSIFSVVPNLDQNIKSTQINCTGRDKIRIELPASVYSNYKKMGSNPQMYAVFNTMIFVPAMVFVLKELQSNYSDHQDNKWFLNIQHTYETVFGQTLDELSIQNINVYEIAQKLLKEPYEEALSFLANGISE